MKKSISLLIQLLLAALVVSCSSEETAYENTEKVTMHLPQFEDEAPATRTLIEVSASDQISYKWGVGDVLGIYPDAGTQVAFELSASSLSADGLSATFDGGAWALKGGHSYYAYFPFSYDCFSASVNKTNIPISYLGQKQSAFGDTSNAGQYDFNAAGPTSSSTGNLSFNFVRLGALLRVKFTLPATATYKTLTLNTTSASIPVKGTVDLTSSSIVYSPKEFASSLSVNLNNVSGTVGQTAYVYMMLPPMALKTQGKTMTVTLSYGDGKSTTYNICTAGTTTENTPDFKANTRYKRDAVCVSGDPSGVIDGGNDEDEPADSYSGYVYSQLESDPVHGLSAGYATTQIVGSLLQTFIDNGNAPSNVNELVNNGTASIQFDEAGCKIALGNSWTIMNNGRSLYNGNILAATIDANNMIRLYESDNGSATSEPSSAARALIGKSVKVKLVDAWRNFTDVLDDVHFMNPLTLNAVDASVVLTDITPGVSSEGIVQGKLEIKETLNTAKRVVWDNLPPATTKRNASLISWYRVEDITFGVIKTNVKTDGTIGSVCETPISIIKNAVGRPKYEVTYDAATNKVTFVNMSGNTLDQEINFIIPVTVHTKWTDLNANISVKVKPFTTCTKTR